ncbi:MAG: hypothetical protein E5Y55_03740 [Mesorhizobium sp.]|nr:MAG: hypothetical protein EOQ56_02435 [Mesorhizobium sp.]RWP20522.1 MAG: hypothetical protein EOR01_18755 [Mesorhizobium sp.]RWP94384.1 MAG: hypothetical protein EOR89_30430 [Mesorhizobium sp.]RWQ16322.1 MAG: hypothetical protein EOR92_21795 [Mesorhizobium sp.]RWQ26465.1 MAG: hypothetical protein EOS19_25310 [Mesorhizobium sp.]
MRGEPLPSPPCGRRWPSEARSDEGVPAWRRRRSVQHPSSGSALRAGPPSPTRGEGRVRSFNRFASLSPAISA